MDVTIKRGVPSRLEEYVEVMRDSALYEHYFAGEEDRLRRMLSSAIEDERLITAENSAGEAVGLMICDWKGMLGVFPYLDLLGVRRDCRGMGIGRKLLRTFEQISRGLGARNIFICVSGFNPRARALYTSVGFRKVAVVPDLFRSGIQENILMKRVDG